MTTRTPRPTEWQLDRLAADIAALPGVPPDGHLGEDDLVAAATGALSPDATDRVELHVRDCERCLAELKRLSGAGEHWRGDAGAERLSALRERVLARRASPGPADASHPDAALVICYATGRIPRALGDALRESLVRHLEACASCRDEMVEALRPDLTIDLEEAAARHEQVSELFAGLAALVAAQHRLARQTEGGRLLRSGLPRGASRGTGSDVSALVFDQGGELVLQADGRPRTVSFTMQRADVDEERRLVIQLASADPVVQRETQPAASVQITIRHEGLRLRLPRADIRAGGMATP
jgi:hypothetical protein